MMNNLPTIPPIFGPLLSLLRSRKFMVALMTILVDVLIAYLPALESIQTELLAVLTAVGMALVAAIAYEDGKVKEAA